MKTAIGAKQPKVGEYILLGHYVAMRLKGDTNIIISKITTNPDLTATLRIVHAMYNADIWDAADKMREMEDEDEAREYGVRPD